MAEKEKRFRIWSLHTHATPTQMRVHTCMHVPIHTHTCICACTYTPINLQQNTVPEKYIWMSYKKKSLEKHWIKEYWKSIWEKTENLEQRIFLTKKCCYAANKNHVQMFHMNLKELNKEYLQWRNTGSQTRDSKVTGWN